MPWNEVNHQYRNQTSEAGVCGGGEWGGEGGRHIGDDGEHKLCCTIYKSKKHNYASHKWNFDFK